MTTTASEVAGTAETIATVEFLGRTFEERKAAVAKAEAFAKLTKLALVDSAELMVGSKVHASFRPSMALFRQYNVWIPCYSSVDNVREPIEYDVDVLGVSESGFSITLGYGEKHEDRYDKEWVVGLHNLISISPIETGA